MDRAPLYWGCEPTDVPIPTIMTPKRIDSMPPFVSSLALGCGLTLAGLGLVMLLMLLKMNQRAKPTLICFDRAWNVRTAALTIWLASALLLMLPRIDWPVGLQREKAADDAMRGSEHHEASSLSTPHSDAVDPPVTRATGTIHTSDPQVASSNPGGQSATMTPPEGRERDVVPRSSTPESVNLTGEWAILNTVVETSYPPFKQLQLGFRLNIQQEGQAFHGVGEKQRENGKLIPISARRPIRIRGTIAHGAVISATFQEEGLSRTITGHFRLHMQDHNRLTGTFVSTAANARGPSQWSRTSSSVAHATRRDQSGRDKRTVPPPAPPSVQGPLPAITEEPRPSPNLQGPSTTEGMRVARQIGNTAASLPDKPRQPGRPVAPVAQSPTHQRRPRLQLGMTQAEVRDLLGEPVTVEATPGFIFWHYGTEEHEKDVVFEQGTGRVHGWLGFSRAPTDGSVE
jgi:hypothetical protein